MDHELARSPLVSTRLAPWLSVVDAIQAVNYYQKAFDAVEMERLEDEQGDVVVARLAIGEATFWVQEDADTSPPALGGRSPVWMILTVADPDAVFEQAITAGATRVGAVSEEHGWRIGRIADPFGHHWEIGKPLR